MEKSNGRVNVKESSIGLGWSTLNKKIKNKKSIRNKWVLKISWKTDVSIEKYKVCLMAKDYTLQEGIFYEENLSPIFRLTLICLILAIEAHMDLKLH